VVRHRHRQSAYDRRWPRLMPVPECTRPHRHARLRTLDPPSTLMFEPMVVPALRLEVVLVRQPTRCVI
jgi:hypothetical protein